MWCSALAGAVQSTSVLLVHWLHPSQDLRPHPLSQRFAGSCGWMCEFGCCLQSLPVGWLLCSLLGDCCYMLGTSLMCRAPLQLSSLGKSHSHNDKPWCPRAIRGVTNSQAEQGSGCAVVDRTWTTLQFLNQLPRGMRHSFGCFGFRPSPLPHLHPNQAAFRCPRALFLCSCGHIACKSSSSFG